MSYNTSELEPTPLRPPQSAQFCVRVAGWQGAASEREPTESNDPWQPTATSSLPESAIQDELLHQAVWLGDLQKIRSLVENKAEVNCVDGRGMTPLMLSVELLPRARDEYLTVARCLLASSADPRLRTALGWSPLDEAVELADQELIQVLFDGAQQSLQKRWQKRLASATTSLELLPDFECRIRWEFDSPLLPLLTSLFAPSDVLRIRKQGRCLRLDSTLASWKRFRLSKRRELTTLFQGAKQDQGRQLPARLLMLNHSKRTVVDATEGLDSQESAAVVNDLAASNSTQWDMNINDMEVTEATSWFGSAGTCEVNGWQAVRFDVKGSLGLMMRKKGNLTQSLSYEHYFGKPLPPDAGLPEFRCEFARSQPECSVGSGQPQHSGGPNGFRDADAGDSDTQSITSEVLTNWPNLASSSPAGRDNKDVGRGMKDSSDMWGPVPAACSAASGSKGSNVGAARQRASRDRSGKSSHRVSASVWLATDFAVPMRQLMPVLDALSTEHELARRLKEILDSDSIKSATQRAQLSAESARDKLLPSSSASRTGHVFPVRASMPVNLALRAQVYVEAFELLQPGTLPNDLFEFPSTYSWVSRSVSQKTPQRARKRMLLANLVL